MKQVEVLVLRRIAMRLLLVSVALQLCAGHILRQQQPSLLNISLPPIRSCIKADEHPVYDLCRDVVGNQTIATQQNLTLLEDFVAKTFRSLIYVQDRGGSPPLPGRCGNSEWSGLVSVTYHQLSTHGLLTALSTIFGKSDVCVCDSVPGEHRKLRLWDLLPAVQPVGQRAAVPVPVDSEASH